MMADTAAAMTDADAVDDPMALISKQIQELSTGDRAGLRRIYLTQRHEADGVVIGLLHRAGMTTSLTPEAFAPWRLVVHVAALLAGTGKFGAPSHARSKSLGRALQVAGYSEARFLRLTVAQGSALDDQIIRAARTLAQKRRKPVNLWTILNLSKRDPKLLEANRLSIAHDYYRAQARVKGNDQ